MSYLPDDQAQEAIDGWMQEANRLRSELERERAASAAYRESISTVLHCVATDHITMAPAIRMDLEKALSSSAGSDFLERLRRAEAVIEAVCNYHHCLDHHQDDLDCQADTLDSYNEKLKAWKEARGAGREDAAEM